MKQFFCIRILSSNYGFAGCVMDCFDRIPCTLWEWELARDVCALIEDNCIYAQEDAGMYRNKKALMNLIQENTTAQALIARLGGIEQAVRKVRTCHGSH